MHLETGWLQLSSSVKVACPEEVLAAASSMVAVLRYGRGRVAEIQCTCGGCRPGAVWATRRPWVARGIRFERAWAYV